MLYQGKHPIIIFFKVNIMTNTNNAILFKQAHIMTKQIIKQGDCYRTTFGLCLKAIKQKNEQKNKQVKKDNIVFSSISLFLFLSVLAVAVGSGIIAVISVFLSVLTLLCYGLQDELKKIKKIFTSDNIVEYIAGALLITPLVFMFFYFLAIIIAYSPTH